MKLPASHFSSTAQFAVEVCKTMFSHLALFTCLDVKKKGESALWAEALMMQALLDASLEHFVLWHRAQGLELDEPQLLALVGQRLEIARAIVASRDNACAEMRQ